MALYKRGGQWWFKFMYGGRLYQESAGTANEQLAGRIERKRRREVEEAASGLRPTRSVALLFSVAANDWLALKQPAWAEKTHTICSTDVAHLKKHFGRLLLSDITDRDISEYQTLRKDQKAAPKTINNEVGTLRAILRRHRLWAQIQPDVRPLTVTTDVGIALGVEQEEQLVAACAANRSRSLIVAVTLILQTGLRDEEVRFLTWRQIDLLNKAVRVGKSKTSHGSKRVVPLNETAAKVLTGWAAQFPKRKPEHFVFPSERVGFSGDAEIPQVFATDPTKAMTSWKTAWSSAKAAADVECRLHDLRHTWVTRLLEKGVALPVVATLAGWSPATMARMQKRYSHFGNSAQRQAVALLDPQKPPTPATAPELARIAAAPATIQ
jgi:integrase